MLSRRRTHAAQGARVTNQQLIQLLPLVVIVAVFYFVAIMPQQAQQRRYREMLGRLKKGDRVLTRGGLYGVIVELRDKRVLLELAQNVRVQADRTAVQSVVNKG
ncbi:MAG TPA: preprotein translocase subunit YajC [bacterium]|nr:preprotein translocase subunit YajC [bacterium]